MRYGGMRYPITSNGKFVTCIEDFEEVMNETDYIALQQYITYSQEEELDKIEAMQDECEEVKKECEYLEGIIKDVNDELFEVADDLHEIMFAIAKPNYKFNCEKLWDDLKDIENRICELRKTI